MRASHESHRSRFTWPNPKFPVAFFDMANSTERTPVGGTGKYNEQEAGFALQLMLTMGRDPTVGSIAILSPYKQQVGVAGVRHHGSTPGAF